MSAVPPSAVCERVRAQVSLALDGELSQLERAMVAAHLGRCPACRAYEAGVAAATRLLRQAPLERLQRPVSVRRPRQVLPARVQAGVAALIVGVAAFGIAGQLAPQPTRAPLPLEAGVARFPSQNQLERELAMLEMVRPGAGLPRGGRETVR